MDLEKAILSSMYTKKTMTILNPALVSSILLVARAAAAAKLGNERLRPGPVHSSLE